MGSSTFSSPTFGNTSLNIKGIDYSNNLNNTADFSKNVVPVSRMINSSYLISGTLSSNIEVFSFGNGSSYEIKNDEYKNMDEIINYQYSNVDYSEIEQCGYKVQGVTQIGDKLVLSAYDHDERIGKRDFSRLYVYDINTGEKYGYIVLNSTAHAGGTTYIEELGVLLVSNDDGKTMALDFRPGKFDLLLQTMKSFGGYFDFSKGDTFINDKGFIIENNIDVFDITDVGKNSTMFYDDDGYLYIATFNRDKNKKSQLVKFKIDKDSFELPSYINNNFQSGKLNAEVVDEFEIPDVTQGIATTKYNGEEYIITSQSYSQNPSIISIHKVTPEGLKYVGAKIIDHPGAESLHMGPHGELICVFETGDAEVYNISLEKLFNSFSDEKDVKFLRGKLMGVKPSSYYMEAASNKIDDMYTYDSEDGFFSDFIDAAGEDGFVGTAGGVIGSIPDTFEDYAEVASDVFSAIGSIFK